VDLDGRIGSRHALDYRALSDAELGIAEALIAKATGRPARKLELLVPENLAPITKGMTGMGARQLRIG